MFSDLALLRDKATVFRQLATMVGAGLTISEALATLQSRSQNARLRAFLAAASKATMQGAKFSDEVAKHPDLFPMLTQAMIEVAEQSGRLDDVLRRLADYHERDYRLRMMLSRELLYPKVLAVAILFIPLGGNVLATWFSESFGAALVLFLKFLLIYVLVIGVPVTLLYLSYRTLSQTESGRERIDSTKLSIPVLGKVVLKSSLARFSRALATLYACGVSMDRALRLSGQAATNAHVRHIAEIAADQVKGGGGITTSLVKAGLSDDMVISMVNTGEQTGKLDETMDHVAAYYEAETETAIRQLTVVAGVVCVVVAGIVVGIIVGRFYMHLYGGMMSG